MANTFTQLHVHFVFAAQYRIALIDHFWKERLHQYITGIIQKNNHKMLQINSMPDHIHILIGLRPSQFISSLMQNIKTESTKWINGNRLTKSCFARQEGYGAFSYSKRSMPSVIRYIQNQETHHQRITFIQEYKAFLDAFEIEYDGRYIFKEPG